MVTSTFHIGIGASNKCTNDTVLNTGVHVNVLIYIFGSCWGSILCCFPGWTTLYGKVGQKVIGIHHWMSWNKEQTAARGQGDSR